jgi:UDP-N-acetylmuramoylalanine-D-glutamate ligase
VSDVAKLFSGGSSNGRAVTRYLTEQGAKVAVADANEAETQKIVKVSFSKLFLFISPHFSLEGAARYGRRR